MGAGAGRGLGTAQWKTRWCHPQVGELGQPRAVGGTRGPQLGVLGAGEGRGHAGWAPFPPGPGAPGSGAPGCAWWVPALTHPQLRLPDGPRAHWSAYLPAGEVILHQRAHDLLGRLGSAEVGGEGLARNTLSVADPAWGESGPASAPALPPHTSPHAGTQSSCFGTPPQSPPDRCLKGAALSDSHQRTGGRSQDGRSPERTRSEQQPRACHELHGSCSTAPAPKLFSGLGHGAMPQMTPHHAPWRHCICPFPGIDTGSRSADHSQSAARPARDTASSLAGRD